MTLAFAAKGGTTEVKGMDDTSYWSKQAGVLGPISPVQAL